MKPGLSLDRLKEPSDQEKAPAQRAVGDLHVCQGGCTMATPPPLPHLTPPLRLSAVDVAQVLFHRFLWRPLSLGLLGHRFSSSGFLVFGALAGTVLCTPWTRALKHQRKAKASQSSGPTKSHLLQAWFQRPGHLKPCRHQRGQRPPSQHRSSCWHPECQQQPSHQTKVTVNVRR